MQVKAMQPAAVSLSFLGKRLHLVAKLELRGELLGNRGAKVSLR
jgi:hypothetical protein